MSRWDMHITLGPVFSMRFVELVFFEEGEAEDLWNCVGGGVEVGGFYERPACPM